MSATIIDSLIVKLGLDSKDLDSKSSSAGKKLKDLETEAGKTERGVKKIGTTSKESASGVETLTRSLSGFLALIGGTLALRAFVEDTIASNAALDRFAKNLGLSVSDVSAWGNAVEELGGSAKGLQGSMDMLSKAQTELRLTGQSSLIPYFSALGVSLATVGGQARPVDQILLDLADRFSHMDRTTANNMGRMMGIDQDTLNLLLQGRHEVELMIARQKEYGAVSKEQAAEASKLQRSIVDLKQTFTALGRDIMQQASPAIEKMLSLFASLGGWAKDNSQFVGEFLGVVAAGLGAMAIAALPIDGIVVAVGALAAGIVLLYQDYQTWKRGGDTLIDWGKWEPGITAATKGIKALGVVAKDLWETMKGLASVGINLVNGNKAAATAANNKLRDKVRGMFGLAPDNNEPVAPNAPQTGSAAYMQKYFQQRGWTPEQAAGIAANLISESGGRTNATGDKGLAYGIAQWHPDRQAAFAKFAGHDIKLSTLDEQLAFVQHELNQRGGADLRKATTAAQAGAIVSREYEGPRDAAGEATRRGALASTLAGVQGASSSVAAAGASPGSSSTTTDKSMSVQTGDITINTQATDANGIVRDMGHSMNYLFASQANAGLW